MKSSCNANAVSSNYVLKKMHLNADTSYCEFQPYANQVDRNKTKMNFKHQNCIKPMPSFVNLKGSKSEIDGFHCNTPRNANPIPIHNLQPKLSVTTVELNLSPSQNKNPKTYPDQLKSSFKTFTKRTNNQNGKIHSTINGVEKCKSKIPHLQPAKNSKPLNNGGEVESELDQASGGIFSPSRNLNDREKLAFFMKNEMAKLKPKSSAATNYLEKNKMEMNSSRNNLDKFYNSFGSNVSKAKMFDYLGSQDIDCPKHDVFTEHLINQQVMIEENQKMLDENKRLQFERKMRHSGEKPTSETDDDFEEITGKKITEQLPKITEKLKQNTQYLIDTRKEHPMGEDIDENIANLTLGLFTKTDSKKKPCPRFQESNLTQNLTVKTRKLKEIGEKNEKFAATLDTLNNRLKYLREKYSKIHSSGNVSRTHEESRRETIAVPNEKNRCKYKSVADYKNAGVGDVIAEKKQPIVKKNDVKTTVTEISNDCNSKGDRKMNFDDIDSLLANLQEQEKDLDSMLQKNQELDDLIAKNRLGKLKSYNWNNAKLEIEKSLSKSIETFIEDSPQEFSDQFTEKQSNLNEETLQTNRYFLQDNNVITTSGFVISTIFDETNKNLSSKSSTKLSKPQSQCDLEQPQVLESNTNTFENYNEINNLKDFFDQQKQNSMTENNNLLSENHKSATDTYTTGQINLSDAQSSNAKALPAVIDKSGSCDPESANEKVFEKNPSIISETETNDQGIQANFDTEIESMFPFNIRSCFKVNYKDLYSQVMKSQYLKADLNLVGDPTPILDNQTQSTLTSSSTITTFNTKNQADNYEDPITGFLKSTTKELKEKLTETSIRLNEDIKNLELMTLFVKDENQLSLQKKEICGKVEDEYCQLKKILSRISEISDEESKESQQSETYFNDWSVEVDNGFRPYISENQNQVYRIEYDSILKRLEDDITKFKTNKFEIVLPKLEKQQGGQDGLMNCEIDPQELKEFSTVLKNPQKSIIKRSNSKKKFNFDGCYSKVLGATPLKEFREDPNFQLMPTPSPTKPDEEREEFVSTKVYQQVARNIKRFCNRKQTPNIVIPRNKTISFNGKLPSLESTTPTIRFDNGTRFGQLQSISSVKRRKSGNLTEAIKNKLPTLRLVPLVDMKHLRNDAKILNQIENFDLCTKDIVKPETQESLVEHQRFCLQQSSELSLKNLIDQY